MNVCVRNLAWLALAGLAGLAACGKSSQPQGGEPRAARGTPCAELAHLDLPATTVTLAERVSAGGFVPPVPAALPPGMPPPDYSRLPAFCRVAATVSPVPDSEIKFEVWMPVQAWNGKFVGTGNGGLSGAIWYWVMGQPLARGYAVANTDTGHEGSAADASFAVGHREKLIDHAWRAVHQMTVQSKAIVAAYYGRPARVSYWTGCSTGGRQGLKEAQGFPADYDAISAGAPANNWVPLLTYSVLVQQALTDPAGALPPAKLALLKEAAIAACDARDGVSDRVVEEPYACRFDPATLECTRGATHDCLAPREVEAARRVYAGVVNARTGEQLFPGPEPGSEPDWAAYTPGAFPIGTDYYRRLVMGDPAWDPFTLDFDADIARAQATETTGLSATDPDLSAFVDGGGRLLLWHGWTDGMIPPRNTIDYYREVLSTMGADTVEDSVRLFMVPGVDHCAGGEGAFVIDHLAVLDAWVEQGRAPERIIAARPLDGGKLRTRTLCPYPEVAHYTGAGSTDDAASFECGPANAPRQGEATE